MILTRCIVIGDSGVGKSSLSNYYATGDLADGSHIPTIGIEFFSKHLEVKDKKLNFQIWDTAGQERFRSIAKSYYRNAHGALICFSIMNRKSFEHLVEHFDDVVEYFHPNVRRILVGTCSDLNDQRTVTYREAIDMAEKYGVEYFEVSAKTGGNVSECFNKLAGDICDAYDEGLLLYEKQVDYFDLQVNDDNNGGLCCNLT